MEKRERFTVVVADDETELREAVCTMIPWEKIGFQLVGSAGNGLDALQLVEQMQPDLLLTDIRMPFITGVDLARQVRELQPLTQIAFLSGYDDFEYAQEAIKHDVISYLLKPIGMQELTAALTEIHRKIQQKFETIRPRERHPAGWRTLLLPLLLDGFSEEQERDDPALLSALSRAGVLQAGQEHYQLVALAMQMQRDGANCTDRDMAYTVDMILEKYCRSRSVFSGGRILTLLVSEDGLPNLDLALEELTQSLWRVLGMRCTLGVSRPFSQFVRSHSACREAVDAQRFAGENGIYHISQMFFETEEPQTDLAGLTGTLDNLIRSGTREELERHLTRLFSPAEANSERDVVILQALATILRVLYATVPAGEVVALRRRCRIPEPVFSALPMRELQRRVVALCLAARERLSEQRREGVSLLCAQALEIIERGYMDEGLSLGSVSEQLHVSPNYLSANMKKYAGDTFINLLIKKRMEVAQELLTTGKLKIYEVARRCGYSDQHYFSFCFKKYYGVSPAQLRRAESERGGEGK